MEFSHNRSSEQGADGDNRRLEKNPQHGVQQSNPVPNPPSSEEIHQTADYGGSQRYRDRRQDNVEITDPGTRGGELGSSDEMPEGGDSTRFPRKTPSKDDRAA